MLESIRSRSSGVFAWFIAILIILTMALFGVSSYVTDNVDPVLFKRGDEKVLQSQYQNALAQAQRRATAQNQAADVSSDLFRKNVLLELINKTLVSSLSKEVKYVVSDETVAKLILDNTAFQVDGKFNQETYDNFVAGNFGTKQRYETLLKDSIISAQVASGLIDSAIELPNANEEFLTLLSEKREIDLVTYSVDDFSKSLNVTDEQTLAHYEETKDSYQEPEKVSVQYVVLNAKHFEKGIELSDEELLALYEENKQSYSSPESREVSHILFTGADAESRSVTAAQKLKDGASFSDLAKELSEDPGSAEDGGSLGEINPGEMVEAFEKAAFSLPLDAVSAPVSTEFGYHLIKVSKIVGGESQPFSEVKDSIRSNEISQQAENIFFEKAESLRNLVFENSDTLEVAAEDLDLTVETSKLFMRNEGEGYFVNPSIRNAAFSEAVLVNNENSEVLEVTSTEILVLRKNDYKEQKVKPFDNVKEIVTTSLKRKIALNTISSKIKSDYTKALELGDWNKSVSELSLKPEVITVSYLAKSSVQPVVAEAVFSGSNNNYTNSIGKIVDVNGNGYLFKINTITEGNASSVDENVAQLIKSDFSARSSSSIAQSYISSQMKKAFDAINKDLL